MKAWIVRAALCVAVVVPSARVEGQRSAMTRPFRESVTRRTQIVTDTLLRELTENIARVRARGGAIAYWVNFPTDSTVVQWSAVRRILLDTLRAREETDADSLVEILVVEVRNSSPKAMLLQLYTGAKWRCNGEWLGGRSGHDVFVPWQRAAKPPRERMFLDSHSAPCQVR